MSSSFAKRRFLSMVLAALVIIVFLLYAPRGRPARAPFDGISSEFENEAVIGIVGSEPDIELELESEQYQPSNNANDAKNEDNENNANSANNPTTVNNANNPNNPNNALAQKLLAPQPAMMYHNEHTLQYANYKQHTEAKLRELTACAIRGDCHPNADKVIILGAVWHKTTLYMDSSGGEAVWTRGLIESLDRQGYTILHAGSGDWAYIAYLHRQLGDMVKAILVETNREEHGKIQDFYGSEGFPAWKVFGFSYYYSGMPMTVGMPWILTAEPRLDEERDIPADKRTNYLGYALEPPASEMAYIPLAERPIQVYILAKRVQYFYPSSGGVVCFSRENITNALHDLREEFPTLEFVGSFMDDRTPGEKERLGPMEPPEGVKVLPKLNSEEFDNELARSRLLLGIGWPVASPSPYRALAHGVPFLNPHKPVHGSDTTDPNNPDIWWTQHHAMSYESEPQVYNVHQHDYDALVAAIRKALTTEIEPYRLERMSREAMDQRVKEFMERDWRGEAERVLELRKAGKDLNPGRFVSTELFDM